MTDNQDDIFPGDEDLDLDIDVDNPGEIDEVDIEEKPSLKEIWENNPTLKIAAIALAGAIAVGSFFIFSGDAEEAKSIVRLNEGQNTKQLPGQQELDPAYKKAVEDTNKQAAEVAVRSGGSAIPTPTGTITDSGLNVPEMPERPDVDPLAEWRKATEARRAAIAKEAPIQESAAPPPEIVPVVQPVRPQAIPKRDPEAARRLSEQMRVIIAAQTPDKATREWITPQTSAYVKKRALQEAEETALVQRRMALIETGTITPDGTIGSLSPSTTRTINKIIVPAGAIAYGQLLNELNSDVLGPVLVHMLSGPFAGGRALGRIEVKADFSNYMVLTFQTVVLDTISYSINAIAMDEKTSLTGQATDVEHHYFSRIILPAAAKFLEGYSQSMSQTGTTVTQTQGGGQATETPKPNAKESVYKGVEESAKVVSDMMMKQADRPVTVKVAKGTTMGIFFIDQVTTGNVAQ